MTLPAGERILYYITASGSLNSRQLTKLLSQVQDGGNVEGALSLRRAILAQTLSALGHCEVFSREGTQMIFSAPAALARLPSTGLPNAVLVGRRQPSTLSALADACTRVTSSALVAEEVIEQGDLISPNRICVQAETPDAIEEVAGLLNIPYLTPPPAWSLCAATPNLEYVLASLQWSEVPRLDWRQKYFDPNSIRMGSVPRDDDPVTLISYLHPYTQRERYELRRGERAAEIDRSWGRYAVLSELRRRVLTYDARRHQLAVPGGAPLPGILARAACLCSGRPPQQLRLEQRPHAVYASVPPRIAHFIAERLDQELLVQATPMIAPQPRPKGRSR